MSEPTATVTIKPLEWVRNRPDEDGAWWSADTVFGSIHVARDEGQCSWRGPIHADERTP
jgi:hypothetical protein